LLAVGPGKNSRNHEGRGQNVAYVDGHVEWRNTPASGVGGDEIYANKAGVAEGSPLAADDSVLLPTDK
jgi:prepilin-type processing-associated H-X9-DG protein